MEVRGRITRREFKIVHLVHIFSPSPAAFKYQSTPAHRSKPSIEAALITPTAPIVLETIVRRIVWPKTSVVAGPEIVEQFDKSILLVAGLVHCISYPRNDICRLCSNAIEIECCLAY